MITEIDLDRLHKQPKYDRGEGKTFDMVVECLQNIDLAPPNQVYVCRIPYMRYVMWLCPMFLDIARILEIEIDKIDKTNQTIHFENKVRLIFATPQRELRGLRYIEFVDHC